MSKLAERLPYLSPYDAYLDARIKRFFDSRPAGMATAYKRVHHESDFPWTDSDFSSDLPPVIYEVWPNPGEGWSWIRENVLPTMNGRCYNTLQLMARPAQDATPTPLPVSAFGTENELKELINTAHSMGIRVLFDAYCNLIRPYSDENRDVLLGFLWHCMDDYHVDGFRFIFVADVMYRQKVADIDFTSLDSYFSDEVDQDAILLLQHANDMIHVRKPRAITIAEDVSGMPGMADPLEDGGLGFNYRMAMGIPALWQKMTKIRDENWMMSYFWQELNRRNGPSIATMEDHVQVFEGHQTLMTTLSGDQIRSNATLGSRKMGLDRGIALHKMLRLATFAAAGEGIQTTVGTEGGCPDWPVADKAMTLLRDPELIYSRLMEFDTDLLQLLKSHSVLRDPTLTQACLHNDDHVLAFERGRLLFVLNFSPCSSYEGYGIPVSLQKDYRIALSTDDVKYGGFGRVAHMKYPLDRGMLRLYLPARTALVLEAEE